MYIKICFVAAFALSAVPTFAQNNPAPVPPRPTAEERRAAFHEWRKFQAEWPLRRDELMQGRCRAEILEYVEGEARVKLPFPLH